MTKNELMTTTRSIVDLDGFDNFTSEVEGEEGVNESRGVIQGSKIKFIDPQYWLLGEKNITGTSLTALGVRKVVTKWSQDNKPLATHVLAPDQKFPDFKQLKDECDKSEWRERFGKLVGPWSGQHCVYLIDQFYNRFTWASPLGTAGSTICVRELMEQIKLVRGIKQQKLYPECELGHVDFPNSYRPRHRPFLLNIKCWVAFGPGQVIEPLPAPDSAPSIAGGAPADAQIVEGPTAKEVTGDEIMF
jgi:hypothetical protein